LWKLILLLSFNLWGQDSITIIKGEKDAKLNQSSEWTSAQSRILTQKDLSHYDSLTSALQGSSGIQLKTFGGKGWSPVFHVRGTDQKHVLLVVDGVVINNGGMLTQNLNAIPINQIKSIKILKNYPSLKYGKSSMAGVIEVETTRNKESPQYNVGAGSFGYYLASIQYPIDKSLVQISHEQTQNSFSITNDNGTPDNSSDDKVEERKSNAFYHYRASLDTNFRNKDQLNIVLINELKEIPNITNTETGSYLQTQGLSSFYKLKGSGDFEADFSLSTKAEVYKDLQSQIGLSPQENRYRTHQLQTHLKQKYVSEKSLITPAVMINHLSFTNTDFLNENENTNQQSEIYLNLEGEHYFENQMLFWSSSLSQYFLNGYGTNQKFEFVAYGLGLVQKSGVPFKANFSRQVRYPYLSELFGDRGLQLGNTELVPEKGDHFDIGTYYESKKLYAEFSVFYMRFEDLINQVFSAQGIGKPQNIESAEISGYEFSTQYRFNAKLQYGLNFTWQRPINTSELNAFNGKFLPGRFQESLSQTLIYQNAGWRFDLEYTKQNTMYYDSANSLKALNINTLNIAAAHGKWRVDLNNITDNRFELYNGYPNLGRNLKISFQSRF
jgi:vitamin B12 transporter